METDNYQNQDSMADILCDLLKMSWIFCFILAAIFYFLAPENWWQTCATIGVGWFWLSDDPSCSGLETAACILFFIWFPWEVALIFSIIWLVLCVPIRILNKIIY